MPLINFAAGHIEYTWAGSGSPQAPTIVMLHEGLGSVSLWRDFPRALADRTGSRVFAYSRYGYGRSTALRAPRQVSYMHDEALLVLPQILREFSIERPLEHVTQCGHSPHRDQPERVLQAVVEWIRAAPSPSTRRK